MIGKNTLSSNGGGIINVSKVISLNIFFPCILSPYFVDSLHSLLLLLLLSCYIKSDLLSSPTTAFGWGLKSFLNRRCVF